MFYSDVRYSYSCMFMCRIIMDQLVYKTLIDFFYKLIPIGIMSTGWMVELVHTDRFYLSKWFYDKKNKCIVRCFMVYL